ncbi:hypothetical protein KEJ27_05065 [Candidatus Bathyarchaeota archaeon]|nr:hypothetical protein [Candidatus Bathyarchaeota archaeon]MBS7613677.1 hypothetical protein [Candidatus Bathyarchaeota archaeon]MBS7618679.1 hypothetical protein [Candidatus Bathyarchaeota archaeon]
MDFTLALLAFLSGFASFLSPCAFPLLPVYVTYWLHDPHKNSGRRLKTCLESWLSVTFGIETVFSISILLPTHLIKMFVSTAPLMVLTVGFFLTVLGFSTLLSGRIAIPVFLNLKRVKPLEGRSIQQYLYGIVYGLNSLTCSLPVLIMMLSYSLVGGEPLIVFLLFSAGMIIPMFLMILSTVLIGDVLARKFKAVSHYVRFIEGLVTTVAGIYLIYTAFNH